jgi:hypothetical protein
MGILPLRKLLNVHTRIRIHAQYCGDYCGERDEGIIY